MRSIIILLAVLLVPTILIAQLNEQWVASYNGPYGPHNNDYGDFMVIDNAGNIYVTGHASNSIITVKYNSNGEQQWSAIYSDRPSRVNAIAVDGTGNVYVTGYGSSATGGYNYLTVKYNSSGQQQWVAEYNGPGNSSDYAQAIAADGSGNVYVTGYGYGANGGYNYLTVKYNSSGQQQWVAEYNKLGTDNANAIAVDGSGNVYVTGYGYGATGYYNYLTVKYNSSGQQQWVAEYDGTGNYNDYAYDIAVDGSGNVYVTGYGRGSSGFNNYLTVKYNSSGQQQWVAEYNGPGNSNDYANDMAVDGSGNVYVTGYGRGSSSNNDYLTVKYNSSGQQQWFAEYNGPGNGYDYAQAIAVDGSGNVYVAGYGRSTYGGYYNYLTVKYNSSGQQQWVAEYNGPGNSLDYAYDIAVDASGYVYVFGYSYGLETYVDYTAIKYNSNGQQQWEARFNTSRSEDYGQRVTMDGSGNVYVTGYGRGPNNNNDYITIKYNPSGETLWARYYNGPGNSHDYANAIAVDGSGNVYVTGYGNGTSGNDNYLTVKYNSSGQQQWAAEYNGPGNFWDYAQAIAVDGSGNVYVTGNGWCGSSGSDNYLTVKYNSSGQQQWVAEYNGPGNTDDHAYAIGLDGSGNVYVTGFSYGSGTSIDYATIKYDANGNQQWVQRYDNDNYDNDYAYAIAVDGSGNVYVTGQSTGSGTYYDYATIKYDANGNQQWVQRYSYYGNNHDRAYAIAVDESGNVYVTGRSYGSGNNYDYATIKYDANGNQLWVQRYDNYDNDFAYDIVVDGTGNVYVTGQSTGSGTGIDYATLMYDSSGNQLDCKRYTSPGNSADVALSIATGPSGTVCVTGHSYTQLERNNIVTIKYQTQTQQPPETPVLVSPTNHATNVPITGQLTWNAAQGANAYNVYLGIEEPLTEVANQITDLYYDYTSLSLSYLTTYQWRVEATNEGGGTSSDTWDFMTIIQAPDPPVWVSPDSGAITQPLSGTLIWSPAERADYYDVYFGTDSPPMTRVSENQIGTTYDYSVSQNEQTYFWQIVAKNIGGSSPRLCVWSFTTGRLDVGVVEITEPSGIIDTLPETPEAVVKNFGTLPADFLVYYEIRDSATNSLVYTGSATVTNLLAGDPLTVEFPIWNRPTVEGRYYSKCYTALTNDANSSNDIANSQFAVEGSPQAPSNWTKRPSVPIGSQNRTVKHGACLAVDELGMNVYLLKGDNTGEFYQFNPGTGDWTALDELPSSVKEGGTLTQVNGKFYATVGGNTVEFWQYDPNGSPKWTQKANVPNDVHSGASSAGVMINNTPYVYLLRASVSFDFYRYNVSTNTWETMASPPYILGEEFKKGSSISYDGVDTIYVLKGIFNNFYAYVVSTNTWLTRPSLPLGNKNKTAKGGADILYHQRRVYCIKGSNSQEFWVYQCNTGEWSQWSDVPLGEERKRVEDGGSMIYSYHYRYLYITKGHSLEFWSYGQLSNFARINLNPKPNDNTQNNENGIVINYELKAMPNICHDFSQIKYALPKSGNVMVKLYDATGREIKILAQGNHEPGRYTINLNTHTLAQGIYYLKYEAADFCDIKKLMVLR